MSARRPPVRPGVSARTGSLLIPAMLLMLAAAGLIVSAMACSPGSRSARPAAADGARILIQCNVADVELWVDDRFVTQVGNRAVGISVRPGAHRIELRHDRYHTHYAEIIVAAREQRALVVELAEALP